MIIALNLIELLFGNVAVLLDATVVFVSFQHAGAMFGGNFKYVIKCMKNSF